MPSHPIPDAPVSNARLIAELQAVAIGIELVGLERLPEVMTGGRVPNELLCPLCREDTPSTEAFELFGTVMCAECAASHFEDES
jgi:hypothetical protein